MAERPGPRLYSIAAHRGFADALVAGLVPRYAEPDFGLARLTLLLPSRRAERILTEAFIRHSGQGLLLPRMAMVGDLDLDETLGALLDPIGEGAELPPAADATRRWLRLAQLLGEVMGKRAPSGPALLRLAHATGRTIDRLAVEGIGFSELVNERIGGIIENVAEHWQAAARDFAQVVALWDSELAARGEVDAPVRRNLLFERAAARWKAEPPPHAVVAAGVTSASPALARLLRVVSELPRGAVILPDLDLDMPADVWASLGAAGMGEKPEDPPFGRGDAVTHPQYHLKLLLNRMGVGREEVEPWHRSGLAAAPPARSRAISSLFLPPAASASWADLPAERRRLAGVRLMECAHPGEESQVIALLIREALEEPERRVALVTPDRGLAARVVAQLQRWNIEADDTAGLPLPQTAAGRLLLLVAEVMAEEAAPVPLMALLGHPLVRAGDARAEWLDHTRLLERKLRGPRLAPGLAPLRALVEEMVERLGAPRGLAAWWEETEAVLAPLLALGDEAPLADLLGHASAAAEALCGEALWAGADGRALSAFVEELREAARETGNIVAAKDLATVLRDAMDRVAVRPPWGKHPRVAIYGLLEARMSRADLVICGGLAEGTWPARPASDPLLPPPVLRALGVPGEDFRIGLAAHDLAAALGAPEVVLSHAQRDESGPVIASRFVLRIEALLGDLADRHRETRAVELARMIDDAPPAPPYPQPKPCPSAEQRDVPIAVTALDRLRSDPYQFYAQAILHLRKLDPLDAEPTPAWQGTAVHRIVELWHKSGEAPGTLVSIAGEELDRMSAHPLTRSLWRPRLLRALEWVDAEVTALRAEGRQVIESEIKGAITFAGVKVHGRADRIDRLADGSLAVVDYKTGNPPSGRMVQEGFALQLGLIALMAREGGFKGVEGDPQTFEYWSLNKNDKSATGFGKRSEPVLEGAKKTGIPRDKFLPETERYLGEAIDKWIKGSDPFTARLNPDIGGYNDYDQLMRLDEWQARELRKEQGE